MNVSSPSFTPPAAVVIRADASPRSGSGHVMRCAALAEALCQGGGAVHFLGAGLPDRLRESLVRSGVRLEEPAAGWSSADDADAVAERATAAGAMNRWAVVDGYHFDRAYMCRLKDAGLRVAWIDDLRREGPYSSDLVVNPTLGAESTAYDVVRGSRVLAGSTYALIRAAIRHTPARADDTGPVVISVGGADPRQLTAPLLRQVLDAGVRDRSIVVVVGPSNPHADAVRRVASTAANVTVLVDPPDWPATLAEASVLVIAAGGTAWEAAALAVPMLLLVVADNQLPGARAMADAGGAEVVHVADSASLDGVGARIAALVANRGRREDLRASAARLVDGVGALRVADWMIGGAAVHRVRLRPATAHDMLQVWRINTDPTVREQSLTQTAIPIREHMVWFDAVLRSPARWMFVAERGAELAGVCRFDLAADGVLDISYAVAAPFRGLGLATRLVLESSALAARAAGVRDMRATVREGNAASLSCLRRVGFRQTGRVVTQDVRCITFEWRVA